MTSNSYMRITRHEVPPNTRAESLEILALICTPALVVEGYLLEDLRLNAPIRFRACFQGGKPHQRRYISSPIVRIEGEFVMTQRSLFQFLRVPPISSFEVDADAGLKSNVAELLCQSVTPTVVAHKKNTFYRAEVFSVPQSIAYPGLSVLAMMGYSFAEFRGYLRRRPMLGRTLNFLEAPAGSQSNRLIHMSARVVRHENEYYLTEHCLYCLKAITG